MNKFKMMFLLLFSCVALSAQEVFKNEELTISKLDQGVWVVETADMTTMYIIEGTKRAMLIDTGTKCEGLDEIVRKITGKPLDVVVTHNHIDHAGNIRYFKEVYMHPLDSAVRMGIEFHGKYKWLKDGDVFDLGNRKIEVVLMPGHTPGSIVLLDKTIHAAYTGDAFGSGQVWMQLKPHIPMKTYYESCVRMEKIMKEQNITKVYCGHYPYLKRALGTDYIVQMKDLAKRLSEGDTSGDVPYNMPFKSDIACDKPFIATNGQAMIVYDSENINGIDFNNVKISSGIISGKTSRDDKVKIFMGIPFAAPPVGDLRWKAPQPVEAWKDVRKCVNPPASAMQGKPTPFFCWSQEFLIPEKPVSEDCLYLNVWTAAKDETDKLPVIVWIHGGGFSGGSGTVPLYDGENLSRKGVVFVTINYRLGIFGFLAHPDLSAETGNHTSGNYGILDQIAALQWVKQNIAAFGGDPERITIAGQSAGAMSVNMLVVSPLAKGLFCGAIAQSGGMFGKNFALGSDLKTAEATGKQLAGNLGANISDLRKLPADSLLKIRGMFGITMDNIVIPDVKTAFEQGKYNDVPLISGWNADDGVSFAPPVPAEQYKGQIKAQYGEKAAKYLEVFPGNTDEEAMRSQKLVSQLFFGWNNFRWATLQSEKGKHPAYLYYFKRVPPGKPNFGAFHSAEFAYALHTLNKWDKPFTEADYALEEIMSQYWVNFAKTGNPNGENLPNWKAFNPNSPEIIELDAAVKAAPLPFEKELKYLNTQN